jgi:threonine aldolase
MACEAIIFFDRSLSAEFAYRCKQSGQLASKMRYLAAQWVGMLEHNAWLHHAAHANAMALQLAGRLKSLELEAPLLIKLMFPVQANSVFLTLHSEVLGGLRNLGWEIYTFIGGGARLMCSWETDERSIDNFYHDLESLVKKRLHTQALGKQCSG